jgi:hypothetical protein
VIDTITSKSVLILGRFSERQKPVLDALHAALRDSYHLVPILFDWEPSKNRDLTETVLLLANMCRFVIADLTDAKSIPQELSLIVPNLPSVPVQPIILASEHEYAMFEHWRKFSAVLPEYCYESQQQLLDTLDTGVLARIKHWEEATDKPAAKERQMREEIEAQRAEIAKLNRQLAEGQGRRVVNVDVVWWLKRELGRVRTCDAKHFSDRAARAKEPASSLISFRFPRLGPAS